MRGDSIVKLPRADRADPFSRKKITLTLLSILLFLAVCTVESLLALAGAKREAAKRH